jgi:hypothetical protein
VLASGGMMDTFLKAEMGQAYSIHDSDDKCIKR